mgnify:CR=1 FL=1
MLNVDPLKRAQKNYSRSETRIRILEDIFRPKIENFIKKTKDVEFHFALEGIKGKGEFFLNNCFKEAEVFYKAKKIDSLKTDWIELYKLFKDSKNK